MLYQGEDIAIRLTGDDVVDFVANDFKVIVYPNSRGGSQVKQLLKSDFRQVEGENSYVYVIPSKESKDMQGMYNMEVMLEQDGGYKSIFKQNNVFSVENCKIKNVQWKS